MLLEVQAGFIGCWGEWHGHCADHNTTYHVQMNGSLNQSAVNILHYLLAAVPEGRQLTMRYPYHVSRVFGPQTLQPSEYYSGTERSRIGFHNDSIAYNSHDRGTFLGDPSVYKTYMQSYAVANVMDGEPSGDTPFARQNLMADLKDYHYDLLNMNMPDHANDALYQWLRDSGNFEVISKKLGYRFRLAEVTYPTTSVPVGGNLSVDATMVNDGWGKAFNPRLVELVLRNTSTGAEVRMPLPGDDRLALPKGGQSATLHLGGTLPPNIAPGNYALSLVMEDPLLRGRPEYSIQLANTGVWESATGYNNLGINITVR